MSWDELIREYYFPSNPLRPITETAALREEIRRRVDLVKSK